MMALGVYLIIPFNKQYIKIKEVTIKSQIALFVRIPIILFSSVKPNSE